MFVKASTALAVAMAFALAGSGALSLASDPDLPNPALTPGAVATTSIALVCTPGYARSVRPTGATWRRLKERAYDEYHLARGHRSTIDASGVRHPAYAIDHLIPIEIGGAPDDLRNLWPQPIAASKVKDEVENQLHDLVCSGRMPIARAQAAIAANWKTAVPAISLTTSLSRSR